MIWQDAICKEMAKVRIAFQTLGDEEGPSISNVPRDKVPFNIRREDGELSAQRKTVARGHMTETPASVTYASVVSRESVRIALTLAALND